MEGFDRRCFGFKGLGNGLDGRGGGRGRSGSRSAWYVFFLLFFFSSPFQLTLVDVSRLLQI